MVFKTWSHDQFIADLVETFENFRKFKWKLNLTYVFLVSHLGNSSAHRQQPRHRSQPDQGQCHQEHEAPSDQKGPDEIDGVHGGPQPIHQSTWR
jgi:hypothetical protein